MTEREHYLSMLDREHKVLMNVLKEYPAAKADFKPAEKSRSAKDLAWAFVAEKYASIQCVDNSKIEFDKVPAPPATWGEVLTALETQQDKLKQSVSKMSEAQWNSEMDFFVGPGKMGKLRHADILWFIFHDLIHHRGQFTIYNRIVGAKVPSIYGPSADEPWM